MIISGWGRYHKQDSKVVRPQDGQALAACLASGSAIARGNGRSYGDSAQNRECTIDMRAHKHMLAFDRQTGVLVTQSGVMLADILEHLMPRGWFPPVTPGTRHVTVGGMVAADVHGKNHHIDGSFGRHVLWLDILGADGTVRRASREQNAGLFADTIGGMGLTGIILTVALQMRRVQTGWIRQRFICARDLEAVLAAFEANSDASYSVAWIDCLAKGCHLGRSVLFTGEHASMEDLPQSLRRDPFPAATGEVARLPFDLPRMMLNRLTVGAFNTLYYNRHRFRLGHPHGRGIGFVPWNSYFYPLDKLGDWNRLYGRSGFFQYQCVVPLNNARPALEQLLSRIAHSGLGSFLSVLKKLGPEGEGTLGFAMEGYTLALDFPAGPDALALMGQLDAIVMKAGGRLYLAKDGRVPAGTFQTMDPRATAFTTRRAGRGEGLFQSTQSERLRL